MHDRNGTLLTVGDVVLVEATVVRAFVDKEYCNLSLSIGGDRPHGPHNVWITATINARQTMLFRKMSPAAGEEEPPSARGVGET